MSNEDLGGTVRKHRFGPIVELSDGRKWQLEYNIDKNLDEWVEIEDGDYPEIYFGDGNDDSEFRGERMSDTPQEFIKDLERRFGFQLALGQVRAIIHRWPGFTSSSRVEKCSNPESKQPKNRFPWENVIGFRAGNKLYSPDDVTVIYHS